MKSFVFDKTRAIRVGTLVLMDIILINVSVLLSLLLRHEFSIALLEESMFVEGYLRVAIPYTIVSLAAFAVLNLYRSLWEYASADELGNIILAVILSNVLLIPAAFLVAMAPTVSWTNYAPGKISSGVEVMWSPEYLGYAIALAVAVVVVFALIETVIEKYRK